jgi:hypothetical protein
MPVMPLARPGHENNSAPSEQARAPTGDAVPDVLGRRRRVNPVYTDARLQDPHKRSSRKSPAPFRNFLPGRCGYGLFRGAQPDGF